MKSTNDMILFDSKIDAEQVYSSIEMSMFETEDDSMRRKPI